MCRAAAIVSRIWRSQFGEFAMPRLVFAFASTLALAAAAPAIANEQASNIPQVSVSDLDLNSASGADAALNRIRRASRDDCGIDEQRNIDIGVYAIMKACVREDTAAIIDQVGAQSLRTRYDERNGAAAGWREE
jgi:UrcA family protein